MTLQSLAGKTLERIEPDRVYVARLLAAAERNLADAQVVSVSAENRFDAAYKAIMQLAMVALNANGWRTRTSVPGHHRTALQTLALTVALAPEQVRLLDALRKQRNLSDYAGEPVSEAAVAECLTSAKALSGHVRDWLAGHRLHLL
jgi:hypothetical protein